MAKGNYESKVAQNVEKFNPGAKDTEKNVQNVVTTSAMGYVIKEEEEIRNKRIQIVVKPSVNKKLDMYVAEGIIKSKNDLFNQLAEKFIEQQG